MMRAMVFAPIAVIGLAACATAQVKPPADDACNAGEVTRWVGKAATPVVRADIARATGARSIRWIGPDTAVTMDYSAARLNVLLDGNNVITGGRCG